MSAIAANTATVTTTATTYSNAGGNITFTVNLGYAASLSGLDLQFSAPSGWRFVSAAGANVPSLVPETTDNVGMAFIYTAVPATSPATFTFVLSYPAAMTGNKSLTNIQASFTDEATSVVSVVNIASITLTPYIGLAATQAIPTKGLTATVSAPSFIPVTATGGTGPFTFAINPALPSALSFDTSTGAITGIPAEAATSRSYTVTITDSINATSSNTFNLTINSAITSAVAVAAKVATINTPVLSFVPVTVTGGTAPIVFSVTSALPAGLAIDPATGAVSGLPTVASASTSYTVTATDAVGATTNKTFSLTVNSALVATQAVATRTLTAGNGAASSFIPVTGSGGTMAYTYSISPALPAALVFNPTTGAVSGTPGAAAGATPYTITITDAAGASASNTFSLTISDSIAAAQSVATKGLTLGMAATPFTPVTVSGGTSPFTHAVTSALPAGLSLAPSTGVISGTPTATAVAANYTVTITDVNGAQAANTFNLTVNASLASTVAVATKALTIDTPVVAFTPVTVTGGTAPLSYTINPTLPAGLSFNGQTGSVQGVPTATAAAADYTVTVVDAAGATTLKPFNLTVNGALVATQAIATRTLTAETAATPFIPVTAAGGTAPITFSVNPGLPPGLFLDAATGSISGNATGASPATSYTLTATDAAGASAAQSFMLTVNGPLSASEVFASRTLTVGGIAPAFAPVLGAGGTAPYAYAISPGLPAGLTYAAATGEISGIPTTASTAASFTITVTDVTTATASRGFSLTINPALTATTVIAARSLTAGTAAGSFIPVTGAAGTAPYVYAINPALPANLTLNPLTGAITGVPAVAAPSATYTVTVGDSAFAVAMSTFDLTINVPLAPGTTLASRTLSAGSPIAPFTPLTLTGGTPSYVFTVSPALPATLAIAPGTGVISGTANAAQISTDYTVTGTDAAGAQVNHTLALLVNPALAADQAIATRTLTAGSAATAFIPITPSGGTAPYTFAVLPVLPASLNFSASTGEISGTPGAALAATAFTVTITDATGATANRSFSLTVNGPLTANLALAAKSLTANALATAFTPVTGGGGTPPYIYSVAPALPGSLTLNTATGAISGVPAAASLAAPFVVTVTDSAPGTPATATNTFSLTVNPALTSAQHVSVKALTVGTVAATFIPMTPADGTPPYVFSVSPELPAGLSLDVATGAISGTPTAAAATANYTITAADAANATTAKTLSLTVNPAPTPVAGQTISSKTLTATTAVVAFAPLPLTGGTLPFAYTITPDLPAGLTLDSATGVISGVPGAATASTVHTVTAIDSAGAQVTQSLTLLVNPALIATQAIASKVLLANVAATAFTPVTLAGGTSAFVYSITPALPTGLVFAADTGAISGTPTVTLPATAYTVTIVDSVGAAANQSFTLAVHAAPVITTPPANTVVNQNGTATLSVVATGFPAPAFQWKKDGNDITGNTSASTAALILANAQPADEAAYTVVVTNASGTVTSTPAATLTVYVLPAITTQPAAQTILAGQDATFAVVATGSPAPTYQWLRNGTAIPGATAAMLTVPSVPLNGGADFTVVVTNVSGAFGGSVTSTPAATLTVNPIAPIILSTPPLAATAVQGRAFLFGPITINNTPATFTATGLPAGLSVNSSLGTISGAPTSIPTPNPATVVLTAANITGSDTRTITLTVQAPPPVITSDASASGRVGTSFTFNVVATNSATVYAATNLPAGLVIDSGTGAISGIPTAAGTVTAQLTVTNAAGSVSQPLVIAIEPPLNAPVYTGTLNPSGTQGVAFSFTPAFGTVTPPYALTGALPTGLTFTAATGIIAGTPTVTGSFPVVLAATNAGGTTSVNLTIVINAAPAAPVITSSSIAPGARVGTSFTFQLTSTGTPAASSYSATGLPPGLALIAGSSVISGTPTAFGSFSVTVAATNTVGTGPSSILTISVAPSATAPVITRSPIINGQVGVAFSGVALTASPAATSFAITSGTLPAGLVLDPASGAITGTPLATALGQARVWFAGTNASGTGLAMEILFTIAPAATTPVVNSNGTATAQVGQPFQYVITATNGPITSFDTGPRPAWLALDSATGILSGIPTEATTTAISIALSVSNAAGAGNPKTLLLTVAPAPATPLITSALTASGRVGTAFTYQVTASESATSYVATGLPSGLSINSSTGAISGSPTVSNTYSVVLRASNAGGLGAPSTLVIDVAPALAAPAITSAAAAAAQVGVAFIYQIGVRTTDNPIVSYALAGSGMLPHGLALNTATGAITGTPSDDPRSYSVQLTATNAGGTSLPQTLTINLAPALGVPVVTTPLYVVGTVGVDFSLTITATNLTGPSPYAPPILLEAIGLPSGLAVNPATGVITGRPTAVGTTVATLVATNASGTGPSRDLTIFVLPAPTAPVVGGAAVAVGQVNEPFTYQIVASNSPTSYEVLNSPVWITLNPTTGAVTGVPTTPGTFTVQLTASNAAGTSNPAILGLFISPAANTPVITSTRTAAGAVGTVFNYTPVATPVATGYVASGLPGGLGLNPATGAIGGTPNVSGTFNVILTPSNANGVGAPVTIVITIVPNVTFGG